MTYANRKPITVSKVGHVVVPGLEVGVGQRPGRRDAVQLLDLPEIALPEPEQDGPLDLGVAAHVVVLLGREPLAGAGVRPVPRIVVAQVDPDRLGVPVLRSRGRKSPRSSSRIRFPVGASAWVSVPRRRRTQ